MPLLRITKKLAICLILLSGCKKNYTYIKPSVVHLITHTDWKMISWTSQPAYPDTINKKVYSFTDLYKYYRANNDTCEFDRTYHFSEGKNTDSYEMGPYEMFVGRNSCRIDTARRSGYWFINHRSQAEIYLYELKQPYHEGDLNLIGYIFKLQELSEDHLTISINDTLAKKPLRVYTLTQTFIPVN